MSRGGICDTRCQSFYTDMIKKEESVRIKWFLKHRQKLLDRLKDAGIAKRIELLSTRDLERKQSREEIVRLESLPNWRPMEPDGTINVDIMKPIDPQVRAILYENEPTFITADNYIHERIKEPPENRHYYPDCTSWIHGWRLTDYPPVPRSKVGRENLVISEFYHPNISSLQRDPEWYRPPQSTPTVCDEDTM